VSGFFLEVKIAQNHSLLSFSFPLLFFFSSNIPFTFSCAKAFFFYGISMVLLLDFYGIPMGFP